MLSLSLALMLVPIAMTNPDISTYDPMADVNRDGIVDVNDLSRLGQAYGSTQTVPAQSNQTVVYVYQLESDPSEVENARVAIIDPDYYYQAVQVGYTNSCGLVTFTLDPISNYTAIAWSKTTYSYSNFTTNEFGEASVAIQLGYPHLPPNWVVVTYINKTSGGLALWDNVLFASRELVYVYPGDFWELEAGVSIIVGSFLGVLIVGPWTPDHPPEAGKSYDVVAFYEGPLASLVYTPDENGNANVVTYVN